MQDLTSSSEEQIYMFGIVTLWVPNSSMEWGGSAMEQLEFLSSPPGPSVVQVTEGGNDPNPCSRAISCGLVAERESQWKELLKLLCEDMCSKILRRRGRQKGWWLLTSHWWGIELFMKFLQELGILKLIGLGEKKKNN